MAWYTSHKALITEYLCIEQNISLNEELVSWRDMPKDYQLIRLQAYINHYQDGDYDYFFSLHSAKNPLTNLVLDEDVTTLVCGNSKASCATIRKQLFKLMNDWWCANPERHSSKAKEQDKACQNLQ